MALILRQEKGSKLTISEMDGNLTYLQSLALSGSSSGGTGHPAGSNTQVQFNDNNSFGGSTGLTFNKNTKSLNVSGPFSSTNLISGYIFSNPKNITGTISIPDNTNALIIGPNVSFDPSSNITLGTNSDLTIFDPEDWLFTGNTSSNTISNIWVNNLHAGSITATTYYGDGSHLTGINSNGVGSVYNINFNQLYSNYTGSTLTAGTYYLITDFQTCYDQPDFDHLGNAITTGNYKTGNTEPIIVFAISANSISPNAYSTVYPQDTIKYDINFITTEVTGGPAKGRITERIDARNNRADYDFRNILFKRYHGFYCERFYLGTVSIDSNTGLVTGSNTTFSSSFFAGDIFAIYTPDSSPIGCFMYYEVISVDNDTSMYVTGTTIISMNNTSYSRGEYLGQASPLQSNVIAATGYSEYYTFNTEQNWNTYLGNYASLINTDGNVFLLSNNVFLNGNYENNVFGDGVFSNTFDDDMDSNTTGPYFQFNIITNDFDRNNVGYRFSNNIIICDMADNRIGDIFEYNMLGDYDGPDFDDNLIGNRFQRNFLTFSDGDFYNNIIGNSFFNNLIDCQFENNIITGNFYQNILSGSFDNNKAGYDFYQNSIYNNFWKNNIGLSFNTNTIGQSNNIGGYSFENNEIMNNFKGNDIKQNFWSNRIKTDFKANVIFQEFGYNNIGFGCFPNTFSGLTIHNEIGDYFGFNTLNGSFSYNRIGSDFDSNEIGDGFGYGGSVSQGNIIGNNFFDNTIGEYFYNNIIPDNCYSNTFGNNFQWNNLQTNIDNTNFLSCVFYESTTVNLFKNRDGSPRLSYYDESDVLVVESINVEVCVSFTLRSEDFAYGAPIYSNTNILGTNGVSGFQNTASQNWLGEGYYGSGLSGNSLTELTSAYNFLGFALGNSTGYLWNVTWGSGSSISSGVAKFGANVNNGFFDIQAVDTSDINYQNANNNNGHSLVGSFYFPATFTIYTPITNKSGWC